MKLTFHNKYIMSLITSVRNEISKGIKKFSVYGFFSFFFLKWVFFFRIYFGENLNKNIGSI